MGILEFADAHPVWTLSYLLILCLTLIVCVNEFCTRSPSREMLKVLLDALREKGWNLIDIGKPEKPEEPKGPRPLNG